VCFVSGNVGGRFEGRAASIKQQSALLRGESYEFDGGWIYVSAFQNRVLFPAMLEMASTSTLLERREWFLILRFTTCFFALLVFWWSLQAVSHGSHTLCAATTLLLAFSLICTFNHGWEQPTDFLDALFTSLFVWATAKRRYFGLVLIAIVAAANRESSAFAGVLWLFVHGFDVRWKVRPKAVMLGLAASVASYCAVLSLRYGFGGPRALAEDTQALTGFSSLLKCMREAMAHPHPFIWPILGVAMVLPVVIWLLSNWKCMTGAQCRLIAAACFLAAGTLAFGIVEELRIFIPSLTILIFVAGWSEGCAQTSQSVALDNPVRSGA